MRAFAEHNCGESKLKCIDCDSQICPKCMVQCPVGNRCPKCTKRFTSHVLQIDAWVILRALTGGAIAGVLFNLLQGFFPLGGFYILFFVYLIGVLAGNIVFKLSRRKIGGRVASAVAVGVLLGSLCTPFLWTTCVNSMTEKKQDAITRSQEEQTIKIAPADEYSTDNICDKKINKLAAEPISLPLIVFLLGVISPFLGWNFSWPGYRRW